MGDTLVRWLGCYHAREVFHLCGSVSIRRRAVAQLTEVIAPPSPDRAILLQRISSPAAAGNGLHIIYVELNGSVSVGGRSIQQLVKFVLSPSPYRSIAQKCKSGISSVENIHHIRRGGTRRNRRAKIVTRQFERIQQSFLHGARPKENDRCFRQFQF